MRFVGLLDIITLSLLSKKQLCGTEIVELLKQKTGGGWKVSFGSIYPVLSKLSKTGLVSVEQEGRKKEYKITSKGVEYLRMNRYKLFDGINQRFMTFIPLLLDVFSDEKEWVEGVKRLIKAVNNIHSYLNSLPASEQKTARVRIITDISKLFEYYALGDSA